MKKIAMFIAVAAFAVSAFAQKTTVTASKPADNIYVGFAAGAETKAMCWHDGAFRQFSPNATILVGKNFTPIFGLRAEGQVNFNVHGADASKCIWVTKNELSTFVDDLDVNLLSTWNINNIVAGYKGEPRKFEVSALYGFGWNHKFGSGLHAVNTMTSKAGVDVAYNFGKNKEFQAFVEPSITYALAGHNDEFCPKYNLDKAVLDLKAGIIYKLGTSNGTNNFAIEQLRDQAEIDALNAQINAAKAEAAAANAALAAKDAENAKLKKALADCENKPAVVEKPTHNLQPSVIFAQGSSVVAKNQYPTVQLIADYLNNNKDSKVKISGYASTEGPADLNQKLSVERAESVKNLLVKKYKIAADRLETEGLGATDKLFSEREFNRVALFNDSTK